MSWHLRIAKRVQKALAKFPDKDKQLVLAAFEEMQINPFSGDIKRLRSYPMSWRRRVGNYRVFFDVQEESNVVDIVEVVRRTSKTY